MIDNVMIKKLNKILSSGGVDAVLKEGMALGLIGSIPNDYEDKKAMVDGFFDFYAPEDNYEDYMEME